MKKDVIIYEFGKSAIKTLMLFCIIAALERIFDFVLYISKFGRFTGELLLVAFICISMILGVVDKIFDVYIKKPIIIQRP